MKGPKFYKGIDISSALAYDDANGSQRGFRLFLYLLKSAFISSLFPVRVEVGKSQAVFLPMHQVKFVQLAPFEKAAGGDSLFILLPWDAARIQSFNSIVLASNRPWVMFKGAFPRRIWWDLLSNPFYWIATAMRSPALAARRLTQFFELYNWVYGIELIMERCQGKVLFSSFEDTYFSSALALLGKESGFRTVNVMHGNCYLNNQFFDYSLVFGEYHKSYLERHTASRTRFVVSGSATIRESDGPSKAHLARQLIYFDQPACDLFPGPVKDSLLAMLSEVLRGPEGFALSVKPHPVGRDAYLDAFLLAHPTVKVTHEEGMASISRVLEGFGIALTAFSTTGLEALANGTLSLFLNPDGILTAGPLAFMGDLAIRSSHDLKVLLPKLASEPEAYDAYLKAQKRKVGDYYSFAAFDYEGFLKEEGILMGIKPTVA